MKPTIYITVTEQAQIRDDERGHHPLLTLTFHNEANRLSPEARYRIAEGALRELRAELAPVEREEAIHKAHVYTFGDAMEMDASRRGRWSRLYDPVRGWWSVGYVP